MIDRVKSSRMRIKQAVGLLAIGCGLLLARPAQAVTSDHDFYLSLLGDSGVELFSDERLYALFAAFNALGYDQGPAVRKDPIPRASFTPLRVTTRAQIQMSVALQKRFQDFFDAHPYPRDAYIAYVLRLGAAPAFTPGSASAKGKSLAGLEKLLAAHEAEAHVSQVYQTLAPQLRAALKSALAEIDPACKNADKFLAPNTFASSVALNVLDDPTLYTVVEIGSTQTAIAGANSGKSADLSSAVEAYAAARAAGTLQTHPVPGGVSEVIGRVKQRSLPAGELSATDFVAEAYAAAVAAQVLPQHRQAILASAENRGLWLASDFDKILSDDQGKTSADEILSQRLGNMDFKKVAPSGP